METYYDYFLSGGVALVGFVLLLAGWTWITENFRKKIPLKELKVVFKYKGSEVSHPTGWETSTITTGSTVEINGFFYDVADIVYSNYSLCFILLPRNPINNIGDKVGSASII